MRFKINSWGAEGYSSCLVDLSLVIPSTLRSSYINHLYKIYSYKLDSRRNLALVLVMSIGPAQRGYSYIMQFDESHMHNLPNIIKYSPHKLPTTWQ